MTNQKVKTFVESYLSQIDDYCEAKEEMIIEINRYLRSKGDKCGIVDGELTSKIKELLSDFRQI